MTDKKIAIMQPYLLPFVGYMQLLSASDVFVLYNDVNFIERGWINRNNFLINGVVKKLSIPLEKASAKRIISDINVAVDNKVYGKVLMTLEESYKKAPFFADFFPLLKSTFDITKATTIDILCKNVLETICNYLNIETELKLSSDIMYNREAPRNEKLLEITNAEDCKELLFPSGSKALYDENFFIERGYIPKVVMPSILPYKQFKNKDFIGGLSILDMLMFASVEEARAIVNTHKFSTLNDD